MQRPRKRLNFENVTILGTHVLRVHQRRKFDSRCLLNQAASTAVNITREASENVCVAVRDRLAAKRLLQTEVQASKQHKPTDILGSVYLRRLPGSDGFLKIRYVVATNVASSRLVSMALVAVHEKLSQASRLWQRTVGSHESQVAFLGLLTAVGHSVTLLDMLDSRSSHL